MSTPPDSRHKGALAQIARRAMQAHGFLPDFSKVQLVRTDVEKGYIDFKRIASNH